MMATRDELWRSFLHCDPIPVRESQVLVGIPLVQIKKFISVILNELLQAGEVSCGASSEATQDQRDLVSDVISLRSFSRGWPKGEPRQMIRVFLAQVTRLEYGSGCSRFPVSILQAFLLEFSDRIDKGDVSLGRDYSILMNEGLDVIKRDLYRARRGDTELPQAHALALMFAANISALYFKGYARRFLRLLWHFFNLPSDKKRGYSHPFLEDRVVMSKKMNLVELIEIWKEDME